MAYHIAQPVNMVACICPICGDECQDDLAHYGMCAECHDVTCEHCNGAGETWERVSPFISPDSPYGLRPVRCECCDGEGQ